MYCVQFSQLYTIIKWPFADTDVYFRQTMFCIKKVKLKHNNWDTLNHKGAKGTDV